VDYHPIDVIDVCFEWIKVKECLGDESMDGEVSASSISLEINDAVSRSVHTMIPQLRRHVWPNDFAILRLPA